MTDERFRSELREHQRARWQQSDLEAHLGKHQRYFVEYLGHPVARGELAELSTLALVIWERVLTGLDRNAQVWYAFIAPLAQEGSKLIVATRSRRIRTAIPTRRIAQWLRRHPELIEVTDRARRVGT